MWAWRRRNHSRPPWLPAPAAARPPKRPMAMRGDGLGGDGSCKQAPFQTTSNRSVFRPVPVRSLLSGCASPPPQTRSGGGFRPQRGEIHRQNSVVGWSGGDGAGRFLRHRLEGPTPGPGRTSSARWKVSCSRTGFGHVVEIGTVAALGQDDLGQPGPVGGQHLLLDPTDGQDLALEGDLTGHAPPSTFTGLPVSSEASAVVMVTPAEGPSLGTAPRGARARGKRRLVVPSSKPRLSACERTNDRAISARLLHDVTRADPSA